MDYRKTAWLLFLCLLTGCGRAPAGAVRTPEPVPAVYSRSELTAAAADMLMHSETSLTVLIPPELSGNAETCIRAAQSRSVLCRMMLDTVSWSRSGRCLTLTAAYTEPADAVREKKDAVSRYAAEWAETSAGFPPAVRVLLAHELLCNDCSFSETAPDGHSAYGALIGHAACCAGFAEAFAVLMEAVEIPVSIVTGTAADGTAHAWNLVMLSGCRYHVDCTWDSTSGNPHGCFLRDDSAMRQTHAWDTAVYPAAAGGSLRYETVVQQMQDAVFPSAFQTRKSVSFDSGILSEAASQNLSAVSYKIHDKSARNSPDN